MINTIINIAIFASQMFLNIFIINKFYYLIKEYKNLKEENKELKKIDKALHKNIAYFNILKKNYYELYVAELQNTENNILIEISELQNEQEKAIEIEDYLRAQDLQNKINILKDQYDTKL